MPAPNLRNRHQVPARRYHRKIELEQLEPRDLPSSVPLHVVGNTIEDPTGNTVILRGVNISSLEWRTDGDNVMQAVDLALDTWDANLIRLPVNEDFWFGYNADSTNGAADDNGAAYRAIVEQVIEAANNAL